MKSWKEWRTDGLWPILGHYTGIFLAVLMKTSKVLNHKSRSPGSQSERYSTVRLRMERDVRMNVSLLFT